MRTCFNVRTLLEAQISYKVLSTHGPGQAE